eukprot:GSA120T00009772001.1
MFLERVPCLNLVDHIHKKRPRPSTYPHDPFFASQAPAVTHVLLVMRDELPNWMGIIWGLFLWIDQMEEWILGQAEMDDMTEAAL